MDKISIPIDAKAFYQMFEYAAYAKHHFSTEIAGWGHYHKVKGIYKLAPLSQQEVSGAEVDTFPDDILNDSKYSIKDMIVQWHSHVDMATFFSAVDIQNIKDTLKLFPVLISVVVNCKNQYSARIDFSKVGGTNNIELSEPITLEVDLIPYYDNSKVNAEVLKKLRKPVPKPRAVEIYDGYGYSNDYGHAAYKPQRWNREKKCFEDYEIKDQKKEKQTELFDYVPPAVSEQKKSDFTVLSADEYDRIKMRFLELGQKYPDILHFFPAGDMYGLANIKTSDIITVDRWCLDYNGYEGDEELLDDFLKHCGLEEEITHADKENSNKK